MAVSVWPTTKVDEMIRRGVLALNDGYRVRNVELGSVGIPFVRGGELHAQFAESDKLEQAIKTNPRGLGYGG